LKTAPRPTDDDARVRTLQALDLLDTPADPVLDGLVRCAARAMRCPIALVSLVDAERQWSKAALGIEHSEVLRDQAFCAHTILTDGPLVVEDAQADPRFAGIPLVTGPPGLRAYAGWPLSVEGHQLGALCVIDSQPRHFEADAIALLRDLARAAEHWLRSRREQVSLLERERDLRELAAQVPGVVYRAALDGDSSTLYVSPRLAELGHDAADWMARPGAWLAAVHPEDRETTLRQLHAAVADNAPMSLRYRLADGAGGWRHILDRAQVVPGRGADAPRLLGVMVDETTALESQRWQTRLLAAVEQAGEAIVITGLDGRIEYVNRAACESSGYPREALLGANPRVFKSPVTPPSVHRAMWQALKAGEVWRGFLHNQRRDGSPYVEYATLRPVVGDDGRPTHYLAVKQDVTEQRRLREELDRYRDRLEELVAQRTDELDRARAAAEAASAAKSAFLATISHEIRTPLNGIIGVVDVLQQTTLTAEQRGLTDTIAESGTVLLALIDDILDFSRIEAGRLRLALAPVALLPLVESAAEALLPMAARSGVDIHLHVSPVLPAVVLGDALRLRQIITNLLGNAIKFSSGLSRPGRVSLRVDAVDPGQAGQVESLHIAVRDNGVGIDEDTRSRLYQPFEQGPQPGRTGGTGLGLAISQRLAQAMGGLITLDDDPGPGCCFRVRLPLATGQVQPPQAAPTLAGLHVQLDLSTLAPGGLRDHEREADWASWLSAAGAAVDSAHEAARPSVPAGPRVQVRAVVICDPQDAAPVVRVRHGQRRQPRLVAPGRVDMDLCALRASALVDAVALAAGRPARPGGPLVRETADIVSSGTPVRIEPARRVLVAEGNAINRRVLQHQLERLGLGVDIVGDGAQALARWRDAPARYAVLLTDLHLAGMDGLALAAAIRAIEPPGTRLPILALTGDAPRGKDSRVEASEPGEIDEHLDCPVDLAALQAALARWLPARNPNAAADGRMETVPSAGGDEFDDSTLASLAGPDAEARGAALSEFMAEGEGVLASLQAAASEPAALRGLADLAHRWRVSANTLGARGLARELEALEVAAHRADAPGCALACAAVATAWRRAQARLAAGGLHEVWILDDDATQRELLGSQARAHTRAPVRPFDHAAGVLALLDGAVKPVDTRGLLLLLDLQLPGMDGVELLRHLARRGYAGALALVSGADPRVRDAALRLAQACRLRVLGSLDKPVATGAIAQLLRAWRSGDTEAAPRRTMRQYTLAEFREALTRRELCLHFQPQVSPADGALLGVEALVRWQHPRDGLVSPDQFVPMAESQGLSTALTRQVLDMALDQLQHWQAHDGLRPRMAVNVSMADLTQLDFPELVSGALDRHGLQPEDLVIEVTERQLMKDVRATLDVLARLRLRGVGLSIDDFGTGHASLAQLRDLPVDELKVDRGFVHGARQHATLRAILSASVDMAHALNLQVVAEGVEDALDWGLVQEMGVRAVQGWFVARPMPGDALPAWWRERQAKLDSLAP
jgi:PAS domain S-box-containing protein